MSSLTRIYGVCTINFIGDRALNFEQIQGRKNYAVSAAVSPFQIRQKIHTAGFIVNYTFCIWFSRRHYIFFLLCFCCFLACNFFFFFNVWFLSFATAARNIILLLFGLSPDWNVVAYAFAIAQVSHSVYFCFGLSLMRLQLKKSFFNSATISWISLMNFFVLYSLLDSLIILKFGF